jgi:hypothetical protein
VRPSPLLLSHLHGHAVLGDVDAALLLELAHDVLHDDVVEVLAAQQRVAVGGLDLKHAARNLQDGHVKGAAAQVVHGDHLAVARLVQAVRQRRGGGLVDDALDVQARDAAGVLENGGGGPGGVVMGKRLLLLRAVIATPRRRR